MWLLWIIVSWEEEGVKRLTFGGVIENGETERKEFCKGHIPEKKYAPIKSSRKQQDSTIVTLRNDKTTKNHKKINDKMP